MEQEKKLILVTWDFTEKSEFALEHAVNIANALAYEIGLIHIVKKETEIPALEKELENVMKTKFGHITPKPKFFMREGSIFHTISEVASDINARMVIMGTHGIKGMQKLLGSWALKVIASSKVPFIVVQAPPLNKTYKNIIIPVNYRNEHKESINWANFFSKTFHSHFHIFAAKHTDPNFVKGLESNLIFINKYFKSKGIGFDVFTAPGEKDFPSEVIDYSKEKEADAILLMTTKDIGFADYMLGASEQYIIANSEKIPVIAINPKPAKIGGGFRPSGG